jgi:hypothetical protein|tara:strand:- start:8300 stop:8542 length:243 start_codon:yes stop_codon:yes gene_type:complete
MGKKRNTKTPAERVYDAFGGPMEVSRATGIKHQEVYRWNYPKEKRGCGGLVPARHQKTILAAVKKLKLSFDAADLVMAPA